MDKIKTLDEQAKEVYGIDMPEEKSSKKEKNDKNIVYISQMKTSEFVLEQIATRATGATSATEAKQSHKFLKFDRKSKEIEIIEEIKIGSYIYKPLNSKLIDKNSIYLPSGVADYGSTTELIKEVSKYLNYYFEVDSSMEKILPNYILFTWVFEKFPFVPYLQFIGRTTTGKTTAGETVTSLCYKAIDATGAASQSAIFRVADEWGGVLFLDEFDPETKDQEMLSFLKSGVSDRAVLRVEATGKNFKVVPYIVKAPKIFTSEKIITDAGLQSRTIVIKMEKNKRKLPLYKLSNYIRKGQEIRNKLLMWRLDHIGKINLSKIEFGFKEFTSFDRRVQQILTPIYYLSDKKGKDKILEFAKEQEERTKEERRNTEEGIIFNIIYEYYEVQHAQPALKYITEELNKQREDLGYKTKRSERKLGEIIRNILGFEIDRLGHENISTVLIEKNKEKYKELLEYYGLDPSVAGVAEVAHVANKSQEEITNEAKELFNT